MTYMVKLSFRLNDEAVIEGGSETADCPDHRDDIIADFVIAATDMLEGGGVQKAVITIERS